MMPLSRLHVTMAFGALSAAAASEESCDSSLLQVRQVAEPTTPQARHWLGWGLWAAKEDFWTMKLQNSEFLFTSDIPDSCFKEAACEHAHASNYERFESIQSWSKFYEEQFGIGVKAGYMGFSGSIDASFGKNVTNSGMQSRISTFGSSTNQQKCFQFVRNAECAYDQAWLQPEFLKRLNGLPKSDYSESAMEMWKRGFIQRFGTHITMKSSHGARVQSLTSVDSRAETAAACNAANLCLNFGWANATKKVNISFDFCASQAKCENTTSMSNSSTAQCVALGGDRELQTKICDTDIDEDTFGQWDNGGDLDAASTIIDYTLLPIADFLTNLDYLAYYETSNTLMKAVEYANCDIGQTPPTQEWKDGRCVCVRECENGGTADPSTCTCSCKGDLKHGFTGDTCQDTYGQCQPGVGTGNPGSAAKCSVSGECASWFHAHQCKPTDVCCATDSETRCCPFGNTCTCDTDKCFCVPEGTRSRRRRRRVPGDEINE